MEGLVSSPGLAPRISVDQEETSNLMAANLDHTDWTDEKHLLYLKHMEATFVNQLYKSINVSGLHSQNNWPSMSKSSKQIKHSNVTPSGQFKVFKNGHWSKVDVKREDHEAAQDEESGVLLANPWIQHYRCSEKKEILKSSFHHQKFSLRLSSDKDNLNTSHHHQIGRKDFEGGDTEGSDQNFVDEDLKEENADRLHDVKRMKTSINTSDSDQVVPLR